MKKNAFEEFFLKHERKLKAYCLYLTTGNFADAEDLVQEAFTKFFNKFFVQQKLRDEGVSSFPDHEFVYLKSIAKNTQSEWYRKNPLFNVTDTIEGVHDDQLVRNSNLARQIQLREIFHNKLDQFERDLIQAYFIEGYSHQELALRFSISIRTIKYRLDKIRKKLRDAINS